MALRSIISLCEMRMDYMELHRDYFSGFFDADFDEHVRMMRREGTWGDETELQAMTEIYQRQFEVYVFDALHGARS